MGISRLAIGAFAFALTSASAFAAPTSEGVTLEDVQAALSVGLKVERLVTDKGNPYLLAQGRNHTIAVHTVHCGDTRCDGVRYFSVTDKKPTLSFVNAFNRKMNYAKVGLNADGEAVISVEHHAAGGVTDNNLLQTALILMVRMSDFFEQTGVQASAQTPPSASATLSMARAAQGWDMSKGVAGPLRADPRFVRALAEQVNASH